MKKIIYVLFAIGLFSGFLGLIGYFSTKYYFVSQAESEANGLISESLSVVEAGDIDNEIIALTKAVYFGFEPADSASIPVYRLRSIVTNKKLPEFIRYPDGAIETLVDKGLCDNASRKLAFVLSQKGYQSAQWNMIANNDGHSALQVFLPDGRKVLVDPYFGLVAVNPETGKLISPEQAKSLLQSGVQLESVFINISKKKSDGHDFYKKFANSYMAAQGQNLTIDVKLPKVEKDPVYLGGIDGDSKDVEVDAGKNGMTPYWNYAGHKYNREWVRVLKTDEPVRVEMILVDDVEDGVVTSKPLPKIEGNKMIWNLKADEKITFYDGEAKISIRRLNSFIPVDQIAIFPL